MLLSPDPDMHDPSDDLLHDQFSDADGTVVFFVRLHYNRPPVLRLKGLRRHRVQHLGSAVRLPEKLLLLGQVPSHRGGVGDHRDGALQRQRDLRPPGQRAAAGGVAAMIDRASNILFACL